jgi:hypothetical protein
MLRWHRNISGFVDDKFIKRFHFYIPEVVFVETRSETMLDRLESQPKELNNSSYIYLYNMRNAHSPTLESVKMVEKTIKKYSQEYGKYQLWKRLPKKMMYQTFQEIIKYLEESGKIYIDKRDGIVMWTYDPETVRRLVSEGLVVR